MTRSRDSLRAQRRSAIFRVFAGAGMFTVGALTIEQLPNLGDIAIVLMMVPALLLTSEGVVTWMRLTEIQRAVRADRHVERTTVRTPHGLGSDCFRLLYSVAEADGSPTPAARELVQKYLLAQFHDGETTALVNQWNAPRLSAPGAEQVARRVRSRLNIPLREAFFARACEVAVAGGPDGMQARTLLRGIAQGFELSNAHAQHLFAQAQGSSGWSSRTERPAAKPPEPARQRALAILGLEPAATDDQIRRRHRELAKRYHPDAHQSEGSIAVAQATKRFQAVQRAYETLRPV